MHFSENNVDGARLLALTEADMNAMGLPAPVQQSVVAVRGMQHIPRRRPLHPGAARVADPR